MRTIELRVHGVGGASPAALLGTTRFRQVWGDRIAGFYVATDPVRGREVEAYCWGGMTSRSSSRVLWLLLFPFMLANVAGWTCSARVRRDRWAFPVHRACARLAALAVTLNLLLITAMIAMDVWAYQFCGQERDPSWLWPKRVLHVPGPTGRRVVAGALLVLANLLVIGLLARRTRSRYEDVTPVGAVGRAPARGSAAALPDGVADPRFFDGEATVRRLGRLHLCAGVAWLTLLLAYVGGFVPGHAGTALTAGAAGAAVVLAAATVLLACEAAGDRLVLPLTVAAPVPLAVVAACVWFAEPPPTVPGHLPGMGLVAVVTLALVVASVFARVLLMPLIVLVRRLGFRQAGSTWQAAPFVVAVLSLLSTNGVGLGSLIAVGKSLGAVKFLDGSLAAAGQGAGGRIAMFAALREVTPWLTLAPGAVLVLFLLVQAARWVAAGLGDRTAPVIGEYAGRAAAEPAPPPPFDTWRRSALPSENLTPACRRQTWAWVRSITRARELARFTPDIRYLLTGMAVSILVVAVLPASVRDLSRADDELAVWLAVLIPTTGVALLRWGWRHPYARRWVGVLWDVGTFWPRAFHPYAPPCYAERAVPDLQRRIRWLRDSGARVLLVGHSQGSVLAAAALAQLRDPSGTVLITFGSPLTTLYGWGFPAYIDTALFDRLKCRWLNFSYRTDYIGGPIGHRDVDVPLPDPATSWYVAGEPMPPLRRHTGYWSDEAMWESIDRAAAPAPAPASTAAPRS
ncbi:hypothetical protein [Actinoplanes philippinensis]|uniref:hypothetical protein n=1 Tax=Actinoplanes philippinensis TaxID=35752 RepID=UPI0011603891|nr:hypothetical protein [Actinoplanes philippinensis]